MTDLQRRFDFHRQRWIGVWLATAIILLAAALAGCASAPQTSMGARPDAAKESAAAVAAPSPADAETAIPAASPTPTPAPTPVVRTGLDILAAENAARLEDRRVGVMALPTSLTIDDRPILDVLIANGNITVVALFAIQPDSFGVQHSLFTDTFEPRTGAPIYSLSALRPTPTAEMLANLDIVIIDVPDSGVRFNPSLSRVAAMMRECARRGVVVMVLDRPNPLGGLICDGPYAAPGLLQTEWSPYPMPAVHGLTMGEMARVLNGRYGIGTELSVVACEGWRRQWPYAKTELPWRAPAPEIATPESNLLFAGLALAAPANVSVGLGTDRAFMVIGAPYMDSAQLLQEFSQREIPGIAVEAVTFTPGKEASVPVLSMPTPSGAQSGSALWPFAGEECRGVAFRVTNPDEYQPFKFGIQTLHLLHKLYPDELQTPRATIAIGRREVTQMIEVSQGLERIFASWNADRLDFNSIRLEHLLY